jgi:hypothetical protein
MRRSLSELCFLALALGGACVAPDRYLSIAAPAAVDSLTFLITDPRQATDVPIYGLSVVVCGTERVMWTIASDGSRSLPAQIAYGHAVPGFVTRAGPLTLSPGCYDVFASGTRPVRFDVDHLGSIQARARQ